MDEWKFGCDGCNHKWTKKYEFFSDIDWTCPECGKDERVAAYDYISEKATENSDVVLGKGGCRQKYSVTK